MHFKKLPSKQKKEAKNNAIDLKCHKKKKLISNAIKDIDLK